MTANQEDQGYSRRLTSTEKAVYRLGLEGQDHAPRTEPEAAAYQLGQQQRAAKASQPAPQGQDAPAGRETGPVGRTVNIGLDVGYAFISVLFVLLGLAAFLAAGFSWWALFLLAVGVYYLYKNVRNIVVHRGRD